MSSEVLLRASGGIAGRRLTRAAVSAPAIAMLLAVASARAAVGLQPTRLSWARAANGICGRANAEIRKLPKPTTRARLISDVRATDSISTQATKRLAAIPRPAREARTIGELLALSRAATRIFERDVVPALTSGDQAAVARFAAEAGRLGTRFNGVARSLGADVCAENPAPAG